MMRRGFFFTLDATLGIAMVMMLLGAVVILGLAAQKGGTGQALLHSKAADGASKAYLMGQSPSDVVDFSKIGGNCRAIYEYETGGALNTRVIKCETLG